mgnify:CR=1 FL=1
MKHLNLSHNLAFFVILLTFTGCKDYLGEETDLDFIEPPEFEQRDVAYVPILPEITGFVQPVKIIAGFDELLYVVDAGTEEIVAMDQSGRIIGSKRIPGVTAIAQDRRLNIIALGKKDTAIQDVNYTLPCIYRLNLNAGGRYGIQNAEIVKETVHPFYYKSGFSAGDASGIELTGVAVGAGNNYYISRTGPKNNNEITVLPPDQSVLSFDADDNYITPISVLTSQGSFRTYFKEPAAITSLMTPPQIEAVPTRDFMVVSAAPDEPVKFRQIQFREDPNGISYVPVIFAQNTDRAEGFITETGKFGTPADVALSGDGSDLIFIIDSERDSLYQFTVEGYEGIRPPPGSNETKNIRASFGGTGSNPTEFRNPQGVAYANRILYVADTGNGRVLRFKLTLDFD